MITPSTLRTWADRICQLATGGRAEAAQAIGLTSLVEHKDYALVEPPPAGAERLRIFDDLATHTTLDHLDLELAAPGLTLEALQAAALGPGETSVRVSAGRAHKRRFWITVDGAPCTCDVYASFKGEPIASSTTTAITLRRNPSPAPVR